MCRSRQAHSHRPSARHSPRSRSGMPRLIMLIRRRCSSSGTCFRASVLNTIGFLLQSPVVDDSAGCILSPPAPQNARPYPIKNSSPACILRLARTVAAIARDTRLETNVTQIALCAVDLARVAALAARCLNQNEGMNSSALPASRQSKTLFKFSMPCHIVPPCPPRVPSSSEWSPIAPQLHARSAIVVEPASPA